MDEQYAELKENSRILRGPQEHCTEVCALSRNVQGAREGVCKPGCRYMAVPLARHQLTIPSIARIESCTSRVNCKYLLYTVSRCLRTCTLARNFRTANFDPLHSTKPVDVERHYKIKPTFRKFGSFANLSLSPINSSTSHCAHT